MNIKLYRLMFFMLVASSIVPVLVYSSQQRDLTEIKQNYVNGSSVGTELKTESKNRQEKFLNVDLREMDEQLDKPRDSGKLDENVDDLLLGDEELDAFLKLADKDDSKPPGHRVVPNKKEKIAIIPIAVTKEEEKFFHFPTLTSYIPDILVNLPFDMEDLGVTNHNATFLRPNATMIRQAPVEPKWFKPDPKPNFNNEKDPSEESEEVLLSLPSIFDSNFKPKHPKPNFNYEKDASLVKPEEESEELLLNFPPIFGSKFAASFDPFHWPKIFGNPPFFGNFLRKTKNRTKVKVKPLIQNTPPEAEADDIIEIERNLTLGANCRYGSECKSYCCLQRTIKKKKQQRCHQRSRKRQPCTIGQIKSEVYVGNCPCLAGDTHCTLAGESKETCDA